MRGRPTTFQQRVTTGRLVLPVALLVLLGGWVVSLYYPQQFPLDGTASPLWLLLEGLLPVEPRLSLGINLLLYLLIGFLLIPFNNAVGIIRTKGSIQTSFFFIWSGLLPVLHPLQCDVLTTLVVLLSLLCLMAGYQKPQPMAYLYHAWLLLGFASWLAPEVLWLLPVYILGAYQFQILSLKSLAAALLGLLFAYFIFSFFLWAAQETPIIIGQFKTLETLFTQYTLPEHETWVVVLMAFHGVLWLVAVAHYWVRRAQSSIKTRDFINFILSIGLLSLLVIYLKPATLSTLLPVSLICLSLIEGHFFTTAYSKSTNLFLILMWLTSAVLYGLILWKV